MFGIGFSELLVIAIVAIIFIGPDKLPETIRTIAKFFFDFKRTVDDVKETVGDSIREVRDSVDIDPRTGITESLRNAALDPAKNAVNGIRADIERELIRDIEAKRLKATLDLGTAPVEPDALEKNGDGEFHHEGTKEKSTKDTKVKNLDSNEKLTPPEFANPTTKETL